MLDCDSVILAIGQAPDLSWRTDGDVEASPRGTVAIDGETLATSVTGVYAGGDVAFGPRNLIDAIADGRRAAASIYQLTGRNPNGRRSPGVACSPSCRSHVVPTPRPTPSGAACRFRPKPPNVASARPRSSSATRQRKRARRPARCLQCFLNINLDPSICILCGGCVDVCPEHCIRIVPAEAIDGVTPDQPSSALIMQEDRCIRCSLCVERCPTNALSLDGWSEASSASIALTPVGS